MPMSLRSIGLATTAGILCAALGVTLGAYVVAPPVPKSLAAPEDITTAMASSRPFTDERSVRVTVHLRESEPVITPITGRITALSLAPNTSVDSGTKIMDVDGQPVIALRTTTPLYRDLEDGVEGGDISALQEELTRLGYDLAVTGTVNWATRWALADLMGVDDGQGGVPVSLPHSQILWLPATSVTVNELKVRLNDVLTEGATLLTLTGGANTGSLSIPEGALPGPRVLFFQEKEYPVADNGVIDNQELLAAIVANPAFGGGGAPGQDSETNKSEVSASIPWRLAEPLDVQIVPAAALFDLVGDTGCVVTTDGATHKVTLIGSELGQTFLQADKPLGEVTLKTEGLSCQ